MAANDFARLSVAGLPGTVGAALLAAAERYGSRPAHLVKLGGQWKTYSWDAYATDSRRAAKAYLAAGLEPGQGVVIRGPNRPEWYVAAMGAVLARARAAGIYATSTVEQARYVAAHCDARVAVVLSEPDLQALAPGGDLPLLGTRVRLEGTGKGALGWDEFLASGDEVPDRLLEERLASQGPDDVAALIYTSGTTGNPKAVMLSHRNALWVGREVARYGRLGAEDRLLSYLPLSHIAEQANSLYAPLACGARVYFVPSLDALPESLKEVRPTLFLGVPRIYEKMQAAMQARAARASSLKRALVSWARGVGARYGQQVVNGAPAPLSYRLADRLVFSKVREGLGLDQVKLCAVSAAPIAKETLEYFLSLGVTVSEIYGASEVAGPATVSMPPRHRAGSVGLPLEGCEVKLAEDGEILVRGPNVFQGYLKEPEATAEAKDADGWYHTGDVGRQDPDGFFYVTDRKKELLITSGGKNIAPAPIEARLKQIPGVGHAVALGDRRNYVSALLTLDPTRLEQARKASGSSAKSVDEAVADPVFKSFVERELERLNQSLARYESVRRFTLLPREFSVEGGELTPTLKLRRRVINEKYAGEIEELYA